MSAKSSTAKAHCQSLARRELEAAQSVVDVGGIAEWMHRSDREGEPPECLAMRGPARLVGRQSRARRVGVRGLRMHCLQIVLQEDDSTIAWILAVRVSVELAVYLFKRSRP